MIDEIYVLLKNALKAKGVPFDVVYGPAQTPPGPTSRIEVQRDTDGGDGVEAGKGRFANPKMFALRATGGMVRVLAKSTIDGATRQDHEHLADAIVDQVQVEIFKITRNARVGFTVTRAGFVTNTSITDGWAGVVYELRFRVDRAVNDVTWQGDKAPEGSYATPSTTLAASGPGGSTDLPNATTRI